MKPGLLPLFDSLDYLHKNIENVILPDPCFQNDFYHCLNFLKSYTGSLGTFNSYRRETERLLQWCWLVKKLRSRSLSAMTSNNLSAFARIPTTLAKFKGTSFY